MSDQRLRWIIDGTDVRGVIVRLDQSYRDALAPHHYPPAVRQLLGEFMAAVAAMTATLKLDGSLTLQAQGNGQVPLAMAEGDSEGAVRAIARHAQQALATRFTDLLSPGRLSLTIDPRGGNRYQGIVPLDGDTLSACLEHYFQQSEQLSTRIWLACDGERAAALLLQELPGGERTARDQAAGERRYAQWQHLTTLAATVTDAELLELSSEQVLHRLFHQEALRLLRSEPLHFACSCSRERTEAMLKSLGQAEIDAIIEEQGEITVNCEFCNQIYRFDRSEASALFQSPPQAQH